MGDYLSLGRRKEVDHLVLGRRALLSGEVDGALDATQLKI